MGKGILHFVLGCCVVIATAAIILMLTKKELKIRIVDQAQAVQPVEGPVPKARPQPYIGPGTKAEIARCRERNKTLASQKECMRNTRARAIY